MEREHSVFEQHRQRQRKFVYYLIIYGFDVAKAKKAAGYKSQSTKALFQNEYVRQQLKQILEEIGGVENDS